MSAKMTASAAKKAPSPMTDIAKISITAQAVGSDSVQTVNARDLHLFLESKQQFADWIANRIKQYDFVENQDFVCFHKKLKANNATMKEYHVSLDMAKELSMVERNAKGKEARRYFIEMERRAKGGDKLSPTLDSISEGKSVAYGKHKIRTYVKNGVTFYRGSDISGLVCNDRALMGNFFMRRKAGAALFNPAHVLEVERVRRDRDGESFKGKVFYWTLDACQAFLHHFGTVESFALAHGLGGKSSPTQPRIPAEVKYAHTIDPYTLGRDGHISNILYAVRGLLMGLEERCNLPA